VEVVEHRNVIRSYLDQKVVCCNVIEFISIQCAHSSPTEFTLDFHCRLYCVLYCCLRRNSSTFSQGCCNPVSAVFHNFDLLPWLLDDFLVQFIFGWLGFLLCKDRPG
jgi:hypothetical protein